MQGFDKAYVVLGQFLLLKKNKDLFVEWIKDLAGANTKQVSTCRCVSIIFFCDYLTLRLIPALQLNDKGTIVFFSQPTVTSASRTGVTSSSDEKVEEKSAQPGCLGCFHPTPLIFCVYYKLY
jgi:hypothetical protein